VGAKAVHDGVGAVGPGSGAGQATVALDASGGFEGAVAVLFEVGAVAVGTAFVFGHDLSLPTRCPGSTLTSVCGNFSVTSEPVVKRPGAFDQMRHFLHAGFSRPIFDSRFDSNPAEKDREMP
jgi:hypothetical protein